MKIEVAESEFRVQSLSVEQSCLNSLDATAFLQHCRSGNISPQMMREFLVQHYFYSRNFVRFLSLLISNLENHDHIAILAENFFEEMGFTEEHQTPHLVLYQDMLRNLEIDPDNYMILPETRVLIDKMFAYCKDPNPIKGLAALCIGAEAIVPHVYSQILRGLLSLGYEKRDILFLSIHVKCDDGHAEALQSVIDDLVQCDELSAKMVQVVGDDMIQARVCFFDAIANAHTSNREASL